MVHPFVLIILASLSSIAMGLASCAVVGVGVLGTSLCGQLVDYTVTGLTKTTNHHAEIRETLGDTISLTTVDDCNETFDNVIFCAPPSGSEDYAGDVKAAAERFWNGKGTFVFTSSGSVYADNDIVNEDSPLATTNPRASRLIQAEQACLNAGGCVLRLAGLYTLDRGAHNYWLTCGKPIAGHPDGVINLLHYDDAAGACVAAVQAGLRGQACLVSDGHPLTRKEICQSALIAQKYQDCSMPTFADDADSTNLGKTYDGSKTNAALSWKPRYESFDAFMQAHA